VGKISLVFIRLFGCWYQSQEKTEVFFDKKNKRLRPCRRAADALLTRRRRLVDTPQTLTQTLPQTLIEQEER